MLEVNRDVSVGIMSLFMTLERFHTTGQELEAWTTILIRILWQLQLVLIDRGLQVLDRQLLLLIACTHLIKFIYICESMA